MAHNQYNPPKTRVADPRAATFESLPGPIKIALVLIFLWVLVECYHQYMRLELYRTAAISGLEWLGDCIWIGVIAATGILIQRGQGWARWVLVLLMLYQFYQLGDALLFLSFVPMEDMSMFASPVNLFVLPLPSLFSLGAVILVFGPGRGWFTRDRLG